MLLIEDPPGLCRKVRLIPVGSFLRRGWRREVRQAPADIRAAGRLGNRKLPTKPLIPGQRKNPQWHQPTTMDKDYVYAILTICKYALDRIALQSAWGNRLRALLTEFADIPQSPMGFPANWEQCPIWTGGG